MGFRKIRGTLLEFLSYTKPCFTKINALLGDEVQTYEEETKTDIGIVA